MNITMGAEEVEAMARRILRLKDELAAERAHADNAAFAMRSKGTVACKLWLREHDDRRGADGIV